ncbi:MAG: acyltransferase family protein [Ignavibacteria bacterium]
MLEKLHNLFFESEREAFPDFLRGVAIILMIQIHIIENLLLQDSAYYLFEKWSYFLGGIPAAPVFVMLMGYFQAKSKSNLFKEIKRGINLILLGLILNLLLNLSLIYRYLDAQIEVDIFSYIFGVDILFFAGLSYILLAFVKRVFKKNYYLLLLIIIVHFLNYLLLNIQVGNQPLQYILSFFFRVSDWAYFPLISWISFPIFGMYLSNSGLLEKILDKKFPDLFWIVYLILFFLSLDYGLKNSFDLNSYYSMKFDLFLYSLFVIFGWAKILKTLFEKFADNLFTGYLNWIGRNVTAVYFFQWIIIGNITTYLYKSITLSSCFIIFGIVLFSVSVCTYLYNLSRS